MEAGRASRRPASLLLQMEYRRRHSGLGSLTV